MRKRGAGHPRALRAAGPVFISVVFFLEGACSSGRPPGASGEAGALAGAAPPPSFTFKEIPSSSLAAYEAARIRAWDPSRRFKALFKAEVSPKVGAIGRGYLSVWWDGGALSWRASAPIAGAGRGGLLRKVQGAGGADPDSFPLPGRLAAADLIACILGTPDSPVSPSTLLDPEGRVVEMRFPNREVVTFQPGSGVPRRIEANGPDGRAVLVLESYGPWPVGDEVPPL